MVRADEVLQSPNQPAYVHKEANFLNFLGLNGQGMLYLINGAKQSKHHP